jgi:hypothetical protein
MIVRVRTSLMWSAALLLAAGAWSVPHAQDRAELEGVWKLNPERTTSAGQGTIERPPFGDRRTPLGGGPAGMGGVGRGPASTGASSGGGRADPEDMAKAREGLRLAMITSERLTIVRDGKLYVVTDAQGGSQKWTADGKTSTSEIGALTVETKAKWDGSALVVERKFEGGVKATDRYTVAGNPKQLVIASKIENKKIPGERDRTFQRVYDLQ